MEIESKVASEVAAITVELREAADNLVKAAAYLEEAIVALAAAEIPDAEPQEELKLEDVRAVLADLSRDGHTKDVRGKLDELGAAKLSEVDPEHYPALMTWARGVSDAG